MDPLSMLLSWQLILCGLAIATVVYFLRTLIEYFWTQAGKNKLYNEVLLPLFPIVLGVVCALKLKRFSYPGFPPQPDGTFLQGERIIFWLVCSLLSGLLYKVIKRLLIQKISAAEQPYYPYQPQAPYYPQQPQIQNTNIQVNTANVGGDVSQADLPTRGRI